MKKSFLAKNWVNILLILFLLLLFIPQTRRPLQVGLNRLIAFSPGEVPEDKREQMADFQWKLADLEGKVHYFQETKGSVTLVNFWATWCPPCIAEMPSFQKLFKEFGQRVNFYFVSSEEKGKLREFLQDKQLELPVYQPLSAAPKEFQSSTLPTTFVVSKTGAIVVDKTGAANWYDKDLRNLLEQLLQE